MLVLFFWIYYSATALNVSNSLLLKTTGVYYLAFGVLAPVKYSSNGDPLLLKLLIWFSTGFLGSYYFLATTYLIV